MQEVQGLGENHTHATRPESMVLIRDTSHFMSFYQEDGQDYGLCGGSKTSN